MTKKQLGHAQMAYTAYERAQQIADEIDPNRSRDSYVAQAFESLAVAARDAFMALTGRHPIECKSLTELSTVTPCEPCPRRAGFATSPARESGAGGF